MDKKFNNLWICTECGHTSAERFSRDICPRCGMTYWMCDECGFTAVAGFPPEFYPECGERCNFTNRTCYVPEMGASDIPDLKLYHS